ncbi:VOC family protein [Nocardia sp. NPDC058176]|uniref:VOC family protein n=1 Tax=Nocardia sp. NPDC058176 TaxID=3346368 RepID=UPI0036D8E841
MLNADPNKLATDPINNGGRVVLEGSPQKGWTIVEWVGHPGPGLNHPSVPGFHRHDRWHRGAVVSQLRAPRALGNSFHSRPAGASTSPVAERRSCYLLRIALVMDARTDTDGPASTTEVEQPMLTNIMYVTIYVTDQDRALEFYTEGLGLDKRIDSASPDGRFLTVGIADSPVQIILWSQAAGKLSEAARAGAPGPLILESNDLRRDFEIFRSRGVTFVESEPEEYPFGIRVEATDPDGNRISLREQRRP